MDFSATGRGAGRSWTRMPISAHRNYFESRILSADPMELVQILYEAAIDSIEKAIRYMREGNIGARSKAISRAHAILVELGLSVDRNTQPELASNLIELYDYMQRRLIEANQRQAEPALLEISTLLRTLLEGWENCRRALATPRAAVLLEEEPEYAARSWIA
jgi:flagellar protein FliS